MGLTGQGEDNCFSDNIASFNSYYFFARCRPRRVSGDPVDFLLPPVRASGRISFQLVAFRRLVRHDLFAIFAVFVFRICVAFATSSSAVATTTPTAATASSDVATAVASTPGTEGG